MNLHFDFWAGLWTGASIVAFSALLIVILLRRDEQVEETAND